MHSLRSSWKNVSMLGKVGGAKNMIPVTLYNIDAKDLNRGMSLSAAFQSSPSKGEVGHDDVRKRLEVWRPSYGRRNNPGKRQQGVG